MKNVPEFTQKLFWKRSYNKYLTNNFKDGEIYPRLETIAKKVGISDRQTRNILKSLEKKGLLEIVRPSLIDRKLFKATNQYHFLTGIGILSTAFFTTTGTR